MPRSKPGQKATAKPPLGEKPTLKTIAKITGLAVPTVSRALNDAPDIGDTTKQLVRSIARDIGYIPNRAGVGLRTGRNNVISLIMSTEHDPMNHTTRLISSITDGLRHTPFHLIVTPFFPDQDPMEPVRYIVETGSADAIILNQIRPQDPRVAYLMERNFPFATHGRTEWAERHPYYDFDNGVFAGIAVRHLAARGRGHILMIAPPLIHSYAQHMVDGARTAAVDSAVAVKVADRVTSDSATADIVAYVRHILRGTPKPDAIIAASTSAAMAAVTALEQEGATVGQEIDVYAKEAAPFLKLFRADILTIAEQVGTAGAFLARAAIRAIRDPDAPPMQALEVPDDGC